MLKTKKQLALDFLSQQIDWLQCPLCQAKMQMTDTGIECVHHHRFDTAKKGSLYFLQRHFTTDYDKEMLSARRRMIQRGIYQPFLEVVQSFLPTKPYRLIDVGCGEGSFTQKLLTDQAKQIGFDLSKPGIQLATDYLADNQWFCVADLTQLPFADGSTDVILDLFSPSHYDEFRRVLKADGYVIKGIPGKHYLQELRTALYTGTDKEHYSNQKVKARFAQEMEVIADKRVTYQVPIEETWQEDVRLMSPIHWAADAEQLNNSQITQLTIDIELQIGRALKP